MTRRDRAAAGLLALALALALERIRGHADWGPSEGVYALSARLVLHGGDLYGSLVGSQPPWVYLFGAGALGIHDSLDWLRLCCGLLQVGTGLLAAEAVWRLTSQRLAAIATAGLVVVTPWATHQHGLLLPEQLGSPLLLGAALLAAGPAVAARWAGRAAGPGEAARTGEAARSVRSARWAGVLVAVAVFAKLPFALPAALVVLASPTRAVVARWAAGALVLQAVAFTAIFGPHMWTDILTAQSQAGHPLEFQIGSFVQAGWNLFPLLAFAAVALWQRAGAGEPPLLRTVAAAAAGALAMIVTIVKPGTGLNVLVPSEPLLAVLAVSGLVWALRSPQLRARAAIAGAALGALLLAQSASLLVDPTDPRPFHRPLSATPGWKVSHSKAQMRRLVAAAERCPPGAVYAGPPLVAFLAHRRVPAGQPDAFIVINAKLHAALRERLLTEQPRCG